MANIGDDKLIAFLDGVEVSEIQTTPKTNTVINRREKVTYQWDKDECVPNNLNFQVKKDKAQVYGCDTTEKMHKPPF